ncbi:hypothetical protein J2TS4_38830 [Paenibacillus sp. J2TS4]|nr:hypothetical protein J2TS4_38830 [Paenibacillus sp. J2TS4]
MTNPPYLRDLKSRFNIFSSEKETESWVRDKFIKKGGQPTNEYPLYAVIGSSNQFLSIKIEQLDFFRYSRRVFNGRSFQG